MCMAGYVIIDMDYTTNMTKGFEKQTIYLVSFDLRVNTRCVWVCRALMYL